ncbi:hypothetical protein BpHYR1_050066 [Brachionus plicatilis]|uniref:Uncharacterized protein n=1 Tax=Brachionus plicatilis TaxID=10195 RepID=A0A3M7PP80_BRAPC|nr:hypothetical protein BpHYR1_050066 [Brachionus plicatilis]
MKKNQIVLFFSYFDILDSWDPTIGRKCDSFFQQAAESLYIFTPSSFLAAEPVQATKAKLILTVSQHIGISIVSNRVQMCWYFVFLFSSIQVDHFHGVNWQTLVWIDSNTKQARINKPAGVTSSQVVQDRSIIQIGQIGHVFTFLKFRRIHLLQVILFDSNSLTLASFDRHLVTFLTLHFTCNKTFSFIWQPELALESSYRLFLPKMVISLLIDHFFLDFREICFESISNNSILKILNEDNQSLFAEIVCTRGFITLFSDYPHIAPKHFFLKVGSTISFNLDHFKINFQIKKNFLIVCVKRALKYALIVVVKSAHPIQIQIKNITYGSH